MGDFRYALRLLVRAPAFAIVSILTLALGIGANTAIFSVVRGALFAPLPFAEVDRLAVVWHSYPPTLPRADVSVPGYEDLRAAHDLFEEVAAFFTSSQNLTGGGDPERIVVARTSASFQPMLGLPLARGRWFTPSEDAPGDASVAVLSDGLWRRRFGADPQAIGRTIHLNDRPHQVIGIMSPSATFPKTAEAWVPAGFTAAQRGADGRGTEFLDVIARLQRGITPDEARAKLSAVASRLRKAYYADSPKWTLEMRPLAADLVRDVRPMLIAVSAAVGLVLLVACVNVANLLLARAGHRRRELAVRAAVGASETRLLRLMLAETVTLGCLGGCAGLLLAVGAVPVLARGVAATLPQADAPRIDVGVLAFTFALSVATGLLFGLVPAWQLSRAELRTVLNETTRSGSTRRSGRLLVAAELALAFSVLVGAGLLVRSFTRVIAVDPGFSVEKRVTLRLSLPPARYPDTIARAPFYAQLVERTAALPGVRDAGAVSELPLAEMNNMGTFEIEGRTSLPGADLPHGDWRSASPGYFAAMGLGLVAGRLFDARDAGGAPRVAIVDELCAAKYWPGENPVGHRLTLDGGRNPTWRQIVGVVRTVHHEALDIVPRGTVYFPLAQRATASVFLVVHADGDARRVIPDLRAAVRSLDPALPLFDVRSLEERLGGTLGRRRIATWLIGVFALVAAALAAVGVYGVISNDVTSRAKEIAIRMALGADRAAVVGLIVREGAAMTAAGVAGGAALALVTTRLASGLLFGVSAHDPMTYGVLAAVLVALATAAAVIPARRAAGVNPAATLR